MPTVEQADGRTMLTPVDPRVALQMMQMETQGDATVDAVGTLAKIIQKWYRFYDSD
jgi:hypothetical protein